MFAGAGDLHSSEPGNADPFGAENDVGASFVGGECYWSDCGDCLFICYCGPHAHNFWRAGKAVPLKTAEDFAVNDDGKFSSFLVDSSDDEDTAVNPSVQVASGGSGAQATTSGVATNSFFNDSSDDEDGASTLLASAPGAPSTQSANNFFADDSDSDADSTGPSPSVAAPKVSSPPASGFFQDDDSSGDDVTAGPAAVPQTALELAKTAAGDLYDDDSDSEGDILSMFACAGPIVCRCVCEFCGAWSLLMMLYWRCVSLGALSASQSPVVAESMHVASEKSTTTKEKSGKKKDKKTAKNMKAKQVLGVESASAPAPAPDVFKAFNEPVTETGATDAGSADLMGFLSASTPDAAGALAKKDKKEKKKKEKKKKEKKKKKKKSKGAPPATESVPAVKASAAVPTASSALGSFYDDDSDSD